MNYTVKWEIELYADNPQEAATKALDWIRNQDSICHVFTTKDEDGICNSVDLDEDEGEQVLPLTLDQFLNSL